MWVGVTLAVAVELVPAQVRTAAVAVYLFIITNIGGNVPLLVPPIQHSFEARDWTKVEALRGNTVKAVYFLSMICIVLAGVWGENEAGVRLGYGGSACLGGFNSVQVDILRAFIHDCLVERQELGGGGGG